MHTVERLRRAFVAPETWAQNSAKEQAAALLRQHVIAQIDQAATGLGVDVVLLKGAALATSVYPESWMRPMSDVDVYVDEHGQGALLAKLALMGFIVEPTPVGRSRSHRFFHECVLRYPVGPGSLVVELHSSLDKIARRPVDWRGVIDRSELTGAALRLPSNEDQFLLVVLHAATSGFDHWVALLDLHLLLKATMNRDALRSRAHAWQLDTAMYVALSLMLAAGSTACTQNWVNLWRPRRARALAIDRRFAFERLVKGQAGQQDAPLVWMADQLLLRDDPLRWISGCTHYAAVRSVERWWP